MCETGVQSFDGAFSRINQSRIVPFRVSIKAGFGAVFTFTLPLYSFVTHLCFNSVARIHQQGSHDEQWNKKLHDVEGHLENVM
jgi:hypothetical protein